VLVDSVPDLTEHIHRMSARMLLHIDGYIKSSSLRFFSLLPYIFFVICIIMDTDRLLGVRSMYLARPLHCCFESPHLYSQLNVC